MYISIVFRYKALAVGSGPAADGRGLSMRGEAGFYGIWRVFAWFFAGFDLDDMRCSDGGAGDFRGAGEAGSC